MLPPLLLVLATLFTPAPGSQIRDSLVLAHEFTARGEFARVELRAGQVYRLEVSGGSMVRLRPLGAGEPNPVVNSLREAPSASDAARFEIRPSVTAVYEVRVGAITRGTAPVRIFWDANATARRQKLIGHS